ncbi:hypothetical protein ACHAWF_007313 [Thalassiosira exigua]
MAAEEDPFELIKKGNAFEASSDHWRSAECYSRASTRLRTRADQVSAQIREGGRADDGAAERQKWKVVSLFRAQSLEYLYKARHCLLEALKFENDQDRARTLEVAKTGTGSLDPLFAMITEEERAKRKLIFERLFSGGSESLEKSEVVNESQAEDDAIDNVKGPGRAEENGAPLNAIGDDNYPHHPSGSANDSHGIDDRRQSIESRLANLDSSLLPKAPAPFIAGSRRGGDDKKRMDEIQRGLGRLGVTLPQSEKDTKSIPENTSAEDQVKLIIQQAQDEVRVEKGLHEGEGMSNDTMNGGEDDDVIDENDSMFEGFEDDELDIDALLTKAENLVAKAGAEADSRDGELFSELSQIRKVQALLLEARLCLEMAQTKKDDEKISMEKSNEDREDSSHGSGSSNLAATEKARKLVESALDSMKNLLKGWR